MALIYDWDYEKNKELGLDPDKLSIESKECVWWLCAKGHSWSSTVSEKIAGAECPHCSKSQIANGLNLPTTDPQIAAEWDTEKNLTLGLLLEHTSRGSSKTAWWICPKGHSYDMAICKRTLRNDNCPYCSGHRFKEGYNDFQTLFPNIAKEWDVEKNGGLLPSQIPGKSKDKYWWRCPLGHSYEASPGDRGGGHTNCPICNRRKQTSFPEQALYYYIRKVYPDAINSYKEIFQHSMELDIYIPEIHYGIEYDGRAFHQTQKQRKRECEKYEICRAHGIKLIRIKEGTPQLDETFNADYVFYIQNPKHDSDIDNTFQQLLNRLDPESNMFTHRDPNHWYSDTRVDVAKDRNEILKNYLTAIPNSLAEIRPDVAKKWNYERNIGITPEMFTVHSNVKVWWKCDKCGHEWQSQINSMTREGRIGCAICANSIRGKTQTRNTLKTRSLQVVQPKVLDEFCYDRNDCLPSEISVGSAKSVWWKCRECGYEWRASPRNRIKDGSGCPHCSGRVPIPGLDDLRTRFPDIASEWDYESNEFGPETILPKSGKIVYWKCKKCGYVWKASPASRVGKKSGCPHCSGRVPMPGKDDLATLYPQIAIEWDYEKNSFGPESVSPGSSKIANWVCSRCGHKWSSTIISRAKNPSCPKCKINGVSKTQEK